MSYVKYSSSGGIRMCTVCISRGVGAILEVVRQNFRAVSKFHDQNWRIQLPKATQLLMLGGSGGMPPQENFEFQFI